MSMTRVRATGAVCIVAAMAVYSAGLRSQERAGPAKAAIDSQSLDQRLLDDLNSIPRLPASPQSEKSSRDSANSPLTKIAQQMRMAEQRLASRDTSSATQDLQQQIIDEIARLLTGSGQPSGRSAGAEKGRVRESKQSPAGAGAPSSQTESNSAGGERDSAESGGPASVNRWLDQMWGQLPEHVRNQVRAPRSEQFLPKYERTIEEYYLRLAEEQSTAR